MKTKMLLSAIFLLSVAAINAQNLNESLGGVKTNFHFFSDATDLKVTDQVIILRAERKSYGDYINGYGWGYGYQSFHIEFITKELLAEKTFKYKAGHDNNDKLEFSFYDTDNVVLASYTADFGDVNILHNPSSGGGQFFYSIDLIDIPIVLLNKALKIDLVKKVSDKNK